MKGKVTGIAVLLVLVLGGVATWSSAERTLPAIAAPPPAADAATLRHGAQLAAVGACIVCHTAPNGKPFAGGLPLDTPFGTIYSTNITPDPATGIGRWSLAAFARAMRRGVSRDGHLLYPAFPYAHFTHMSDDDVAAVYAFLMSRDPVEARAPHNRLMFPLNFRPLVAGWNLLYLHPGPEAADASRNPSWNRGRYLVNGPGHCAACHTPMNLLGAEKGDEPFAGGMIDGWDAPALLRLLDAPTPWTHAQLVAYLRTGLADQHGAAAGPMGPVTQQLAHADPADVDAIATYLLAQQRAPAPRTMPVPAADKVAALGGPHGEGRILFMAACASCHAPGSPMQTQIGRPSLSLSTAVNAASPRNVVRMILEGIHWNGNEATRYMPSFATTFNDEQIAALAHYTRAEFSSQAPWSDLDADTVAKYRKETPSP